MKAGPYGFTVPGTAPIAVQPPSTTRLWPVTWAAASESRNSAAAATSALVATWPFGVASAQAIILFLIVLTLSLVQFRFFERRVHYAGGEQ